MWTGGDFKNLFCYIRTQCYNNVPINTNCHSKLLWHHSIEPKTVTEISPHNQIKYKKLHIASSGEIGGKNTKIIFIPFLP